MITSVTALGREIPVSDSNNRDGAIIKVLFFRLEVVSNDPKYSGSISNFNGQFVGEIDLEQAIVKYIESMYKDTVLVKISRFRD